jgi:amidohydrolase
MFNPIQLRHQLHAHPELSGQEIWTAAFIVAQLQQMGITKIHTHFAQHCVLAEIDGQNVGKTLLFRCELDALPIQEVNSFEYRSTQQGVSHKCGHDGHCATMLTFAQKLVNQPITHGKILLFFQSAEEIGAGAKIAIESNLFESFSIDYICHRFHWVRWFAKKAFLHLLWRVFA